MFLSFGGVQSSLTVVLAVVTFACSSQGRCGKPLTALKGQIPSPNYTDVYDANRQCEWTVSAPGNGTSLHVELKFSKFNILGSMPDCKSGDYLEVFLSCEFKSIGRFCGSISPPTIYSPDHCMKLVVHSDDAHSNIDFQATYAVRPRDTAISNITGGCGTGIRENVKQGVIFSPLWPRSHPQYVDCVWEVSTRKNLNLRLSFYEFDVQKQSPCSDYFVDVRSGINGFRHATPLLEKARECGNKEPFSIQVKSNTVFIHFISGASVGPHGFAAGYIAFELDEAPFNSNVLLIFGIIFLVMLLFAGKMLFEKLCSSKTCADIHIRNIRMRTRRSKRVFPESPVHPIVIGNIRVQSAPTLQESLASSSFHCEQYTAEGNLVVTRHYSLDGTSNVKMSSKSFRFETDTPPQRNGRY